jgi:hypothetical protein
VRRATLTGISTGTLGRAKEISDSLPAKNADRKNPEPSTAKVAGSGAEVAATVPPTNINVPWQKI